MASRCAIPFPPMHSNVSRLPRAMQSIFRFQLILQYVHLQTRAFEIRRRARAGSEPSAWMNWKRRRRRKKKWSNVWHRERRDDRRINNFNKNYIKRCSKGSRSSRCRPMDRPDGVMWGKNLYKHYSQMFTNWNRLRERASSLFKFRFCIFPSPMRNAAATFSAESTTENSRKTSSHADFCWWTDTWLWNFVFRSYMTFASHLLSDSRLQDDIERTMSASAHAASQ